MPNNLFNALGNQRLPGPMGDVQNLMKQFNQFRQTFRGNPQEQIQQMMNSGQITQDQYNQAVQVAQQMMKYLK